MVKRKTRAATDAREQQLQQLWDQLPAIHCQGLCADSCYSMGQTRTEQQIIQRRTGVDLPLAHAGQPCRALTVLRRCAVYEHRPMICRLWGMVPTMRCNYGCIPEGGFLTDQQAYEILARSAEIDGDPHTAEQMRAPFRQDPATAERALRGMQKERDLAWQARRTNALQVLPGGRLERRNPR
jgi:Fe-S-cluster containining protein